VLYHLSELFTSSRDPPPPAVLEEDGTRTRQCAKRNVVSRLNGLHRRVALGVVAG
jgi:hypothetical protein